MAGVLVTAVVAVAFGTGFTATRALAGSDGVWMRKGDTVVHINGPSARFDAVVADHPVRLASSAKDPLEVVQTPDGKVYTANPLTGRVYRIDLGTMGPDQGTVGSAVLVSGGKAFLVDPKAGTITPADPQTGAPGKSIRVPGPIASQAIGPDAVAYVGQKDGSVTTVRGGKVHTARVAPPGATIDVSAVGDQPVAVDVTNGGPSAERLGGVLAHDPAARWHRRCPSHGSEPARGSALVGERRHPGVGRPVNRAVHNGPSAGW